MTVTVNAFQTFTTYPRDALDWSTGQKRIIHDNQTGDDVMFLWDTANTKIAIAVSKDHGATWTLVASDASNATGSEPNAIQAVAQSSNGRVHALINNASTHRWSYSRFKLNVSSGHVVGYEIEQTALLFPNHAPDPTSDPRGNILISNQNGFEQIFWEYQMGNTGGPTTDIDIYVGYSTNSNPTSTGHFVGLSGSGSDTDIWSFAGNANTSNHICQATLAQDTISGDVYCYIGPMNADYSESVSFSNDWNVVAIRMIRSGQNWTLGTNTTCAQVPGGGGLKPEVLAASSNAGKAWLMYMDSTGGIKFGYMNGATFTANAVTSPDSTAARAALAAMQADDYGNIWCVFNHYGTVSTPTPAGKWSFYQSSNTTWTHTTDSTAALAEGFSGSVGWSRGLIGCRYLGDVAAQTTSSRDLGSVYVPDVTFSLQPISQTTTTGNTVAFSVTAAGGNGSLSYQWQDTSTGTFANIASATSSTYTTAATTEAFQGRQYRCVVTDAVSPTNSATAQLSIADMPIYLWDTSVPSGNDIWLRDPTQHNTVTNITVNVPLGTLALTGQVPTISVSANNSIAVPSGSLTLTGQVPTVLTPIAISAPAGSLTMTAQVPTISVTANTSISVPLGTLSLTGQVPTVTATANQTISVPAGTLTMTGFAPTITVSGSVTINVPAGALTITALTPTVIATANQTVDVPAGSLALTGFAPTVLSGTSVQVPAGSLTLIALTPTIAVTQNVLIDVPLATLLMTGLPPVVIGSAPDDPRGFMLGNEPRRRSKHVIRNGQIIKESINPSPIQVVSNDRVTKVPAALVAKAATVQTAEDETIVRATINLMFELL